MDEWHRIEQIVDETRQLLDILKKLSSDHYANEDSDDDADETLEMRHAALQMSIMRVRHAQNIMDEMTMLIISIREAEGLLSELDDVITFWENTLVSNATYKKMTSLHYRLIVGAASAVSIFSLYAAFVFLGL